MSKSFFRNILPVVGNAFFGPVGGVAGGAIGGALFPPGSPKIDGQGLTGGIDQLPPINLPSINLPEISYPNVSDFFAPINLQTGAFNFSGGGGDFSLDRVGPDPRKIFDQRIGGFFGSIDEMRGRFPVGFSEIRQARQSAVDAARQRGMSSLQERLSNRRIQGSSFARAEQVQGEAEFAKIGAEQQAQSFLEEVAVNQKLYETEIAGFNAVMDRARTDFEEYRLGLDTAKLSADVGTAQQQLNLQGQIAELDASTQAQVARLNAENQAQIARGNQIANLFSTYSNLQIEADRITQDYWDGIGDLAGLAFAPGGPASAGGATSSGVGGHITPGAGISTSVPPTVSNPFSFTGPITSGNLGIGRF